MDDLAKAVAESQGEGKTDVERSIASASLRGVVMSVVDRIGHLRKSVQRQETVLTRIRNLLDDRARYEREQGDHEDARVFFEVVLEEADSVDDLIYHMERHHWARECDEYAAVWATHMAHKLVGAMTQMLEMVEAMDTSDGRAA
jgi:hypothetical protein